MNIEIMGQKMVKVTLTDNDLKQYHISYDKLDYNNAETRRVVYELIQLIRENTTVDLSSKKILVETFRAKNGGCIFYISANLDIIAYAKPISKNSSGFNTPLIFEFSNFDNLCSACKHLYKMYNHIILKSNLFVNNQNYVLTLYTYFKQDDKIINLATEYGEYFGQGDLKNALIAEHSDIIIKNNAIEFMFNYIV